MKDTDYDPSCVPAQAREERGVYLNCTGAREGGGEQDEPEVEGGLRQPALSRHGGPLMF